MSTPPIVHNYYVQDESSVPVPIFITPNVSMESIVLSQSKSVPYVREKRNREMTQHENRVDGITVRTSAANLNLTENTLERKKKIVNPYDKRHQGPVKPIYSEKEDEITCLNWSGDNYRRTKLSRKEPFILAEKSYNNDDGGSSADKNLLSYIRTDIKRMQDQYDYLSKLVDETRVELQRSREASEHTKETTLKSLSDMRVDIAQVGKHISLLEERQTLLEKALSSLNRLETLVDTFRGDIEVLRKEVNQKSNAIAVLEKMIEDVKKNTSTSLSATTAVPLFTYPQSTTTSHNNNNTTTNNTANNNNSNNTNINSESYGGSGGGGNNKSDIVGTAGDLNKTNRKDIFLFSGGPANITTSTTGFGFSGTIKTNEANTDNSSSPPKNPFSFGGTSSGLTTTSSFGFNTLMKTTGDSTNNTNNNNTNNISSFTSVNGPNSIPTFSFAGVVPSAPSQPSRTGEVLPSSSFTNSNVFTSGTQSTPFNNILNGANMTTQPTITTATTAATTVPTTTTTPQTTTPAVVTSSSSSLLSPFGISSDTGRFNNTVFSTPMTTGSGGISSGPTAGGLNFAQPTCLGEKFMSTSDKGSILGRAIKKRTSNRY